MSTPTNEEQGNLKSEVHGFWNAQSCGTQHTNEAKHSLSYFEEIEAYRYMAEPEIFAFAQFTRYYGKKVLEVGVGAGTDFLQWVRAGAEAYGIDLTQEGVENAVKRLDAYGLKAKEIQVGDSENLPYPDNFFDLAYSWGVIHHSPDTIKALEEIIRVTRPGGECKIMVYNRYSLEAFYVWLKECAFKGKFYKSLTWAMYHCVESLGTKAYTRAEMNRILAKYQIEDVKIDTQVGYVDLFKGGGAFKQWCARCGAWVLGWEKGGWFMKISFRKVS